MAIALNEHIQGTEYHLIGYLLIVEILQQQIAILPPLLMWLEVVYLEEEAVGSYCIHLLTNIYRDLERVKICCWSCSQYID